MLKSLALASALLCALTINAEARQRAPNPAYASCIPTSDVMRPCAYQPDFLAGVRSIRVVMKRERIVKIRPVNKQAAIVGARPSSCPPRAWCGCWLASHLGISDRSLWLARNWTRVGHSAGGPQVGAIVVWRHHVGTIKAVEGNRILVLSGNDGRAVRERWRTTAGVIAYRVAG